MAKVDLSLLRQWIGRETSSLDAVSPRHTRLLAATLGLQPGGFNPGTRLPPLWHWIFFLEGLPPPELGPDGHPARGGFLPPVELPHRMWAGGSLEFFSDLKLGFEVEKRSRIIDIEHKQGRSGELVFVKVLHEIRHEGALALSEVHDIVYKEASNRVAPAQPGPPAAKSSRPFRPDSTLLFRYSALTFNGHRIHYDLDYCREVEGYSNLVVHGPLLATMLAGFAEEIGGRPLRTFRYRGVRPSLLGSTLSVNAGEGSGPLELWIGLPDGTVSMRATATF